MTTFAPILPSGWCPSLGPSTAATPAQVLAFKVRVVTGAAMRVAQLRFQERESLFGVFWSDPVNISAALGPKATAGMFAADAKECTDLAAALTAAGGKAPTFSQLEATKWNVVVASDGGITITAK